MEAALQRLVGSLHVGVHGPGRHAAVRLTADRRRRRRLHRQDPDRVATREEWTLLVVSLTGFIHNLFVIAIPTEACVYARSRTCRHTVLHHATTNCL